VSNAQKETPAARAKLHNSTPDDPGRRKREAWNVYIVTDNVKALYEEYSALSGVRIPRQLCPQDYGMLEFDVIDLNRHRLVFAQPLPEIKRPRITFGILRPYNPDN